MFTRRPFCFGSGVWPDLSLAAVLRLIRSYRLVCVGNRAWDWLSWLLADVVVRLSGSGVRASQGSPVWPGRSWPDGSRTNSPLAGRRLLAAAAAAAGKHWSSAPDSGPDRPAQICSDRSWLTRSLHGLRAADVIAHRLLTVSLSEISCLCVLSILPFSRSRQQPIIFFILILLFHQSRQGRISSGPVFILHYQRFSWNHPDFQIRLFSFFYSFIFFW